MYEHLNQLREKLLKLDIESSPDPWQLKSIISVGGLESVGFDRHSDNLLIVSSQGRGVVDCLTGEKISRDYNDWNFERYYRYLEVEGIGNLARKTISNMIESPINGSAYYENPASISRHRPQP